MSLGVVLLTLLAAVAVLALPTWPHSQDWGRAPSITAGALGAAVIVLLWLAR